VGLSELESASAWLSQRFWQRRARVSSIRLMPGPAAVPSCPRRNRSEGSRRLTAHRVAFIDRRGRMLPVDT
jgi:hypothetical protein